MKFITFIVVIILVCGLLIVNAPEAWPLILSGSIAFSLLFIGLASFNIQWNFFTKAINSGPAGTLAITFDDGPHPVNTGKVLDILNQENVKASFFLIGRNVEAHPELAKRMVNEGHTIGNHSFNHSNMHGFLSTGKVEREIRDTNLAISNTTGAKVKLYRPPFGVTNPNIAKAVKKSEMICIGWDIRTYDTVVKDATKLLQKLKNKIDNGGSILLLHDTCDVALEVLPDIIDHCRKSGVKLISLDEVV